MDSGLDEETFNLIVSDLNGSIQKNTLIYNDLETAAKKLKRNIDDKPYSISDVNLVLSELKENMNKTAFDKQDVLNVVKEIQARKLKNLSFADKLKNFSKLPLQDQLFNYAKLVFETIMEMLDDFVVLLVAILIVLNLQFRSKVSSSLLYPSNPNTFPYVYFDEKNRSSQSFLTSCIETNTKDIEDDVFLDTPAFFTSDGKYSIDKNICKINDVHGFSDIGKQAKCKTTAGEENSEFFQEKINFENMNFFAKQFIQTNSSKTTNDLSLYGLITYLMAYSTIFTNGNLSSVNDFFKPCFKEKANPNMIELGIFAFMVMMFYGMFDSSKTSFGTLFQKFIHSKDENSVLNRYGIFDKAVKVISGFFSPFMMFFKLLLVLTYPVVLFHCTYGYIQYSMFAAGIFTKLFCYFGVAFSLTNLLSFIALLIQIVIHNHKSIDDVFEQLVKSFMDLFNYALSTMTNSGYSKEMFSDKDGSSGICPNLFDLSYFSSMLYYLMGLIGLPIVIILLMTPFAVSLYLTFKTTKSITLDYIRYIQKLVCNMLPYKLVIRMMFYGIIILEIMKHIESNFKFTTFFILFSIILVDLRKDYLKQTLESNKCMVEDNGLEVGEKISDLIMSNNNNNGEKENKSSSSSALKMGAKAAKLGAKIGLKAATGGVI